LKSLFAEISKVEELDDGTVNVFGIASSETRDRDGEVILASAMKAALPEWLTFGNIREMHQPIAAGTAIEAHVNDAGMTELGAHIVDPSSVKKVKAGVLKGFSIKGPVYRRNKKDKTVIEKLGITEISLVDRPANPDSLITLVKFDKSGRRKPMADVAVDDDAETDDVEKGMYDVGQLASLIQSLAYLQSSAAYEAASEKDGSSMPSKLKTAVEGLVSCLRDMVDEETREMLGGMVDALSMAKALDEGGIEKVGRKFSATTVKMLGDVHSSMKDCCEKLDKLGYNGPDNPENQDMNDAEKAANDKAIADQISKAVGDVKTELQKSIDTLKTENAALNDRVTKAEGAVATEKKRADDATQLANDLAAQAVEKGFVKPVAKTADGATPEEGRSRRKEGEADRRRTPN
jgi:hypothetical protein